MPVNVEKITRERLQMWAERSIGAHATPVMLLSVGHGHVAGQLVVCVTSEKTDAEIITMLYAAIAELRK